jgi:hypothetical protein
MKWKGAISFGIWVGVVIGAGISVGERVEVGAGGSGGAVGLGGKEAVTISLVRVISATGSSGVDISSQDGKVSDANRRMMAIKYLAIFDLL